MAMGAILAITLLGALLRLYHLGWESLWLDELLSWSMSHGVSLAHSLVHGAATETNPPGYQLLLVLVERYLGDTETMLRLPSALAGIACIPALYALGRRMYSSWVGLAAALLLAVSWAPIYFSQEARTYALALLATLFTLLLWYPLFVSRVRTVKSPRRWMASYVAAALVLLYLHYYGILIVLGQALFALYLHRRGGGEDRQRVRNTYLVVFLAYLPWLLVGVYQYVRLHNVDWITEPQPRFLFDYLRFAFNDYDPFAWIALGALVALAILVVLQRRRAAQADFVREDAIILGWLLFPLVAAYLVSIIGRPLLVTRYLLIAVPAIYLIVARVLALLPGPRWVRTAAVMVLAAAILLDLTGRMAYYTAPHKTQFREAVAYVVQNDVSNTASAVITIPRGASMYDYYFEHQGSRLRSNAKGGRKSDIPGVEKALAQSQPERLWFIRADRPVDPAFLDYLQRDWQLVSIKSFLNVDVSLYERR